MQYEALLQSATLNVSLFFNLAFAAISSRAAALGRIFRDVDDIWQWTVWIKDN